MLARLILEDEPGAWVDFEFRGRLYRARMDPMWLGAETLPELMEKPRLMWQLLDEASQFRAMTGDPFGKRVIALLGDYLDAVGLGFKGFGLLLHAIERIDLLEVDLLRLGLDVRDWLRPEGSLSSRRVALLVADFLDRPETCLGAAHFDVVPLSKGEILLARYVGGPKEGEPHMFLKAPSTLEAERQAQVAEAEKRERIKRRGF